MIVNAAFHSLENTKCLSIHHSKCYHANVFHCCTVLVSVYVVINVVVKGKKSLCHDVSDWNRRTLGRKQKMQELNYKHYPAMFARCVSKCVYLAGGLL